MKKMTESKDLIVGLDIGTSKIVALVGEPIPEGGVNIIGMGQAPSRGLKKGVVVNIEATGCNVIFSLTEVSTRDTVADNRTCRVSNSSRAIATTSNRKRGARACRDREDFFLGGVWVNNQRVRKVGRETADGHHDE